MRHIVAEAQSRILWHVKALEGAMRCSGEGAEHNVWYWAERVGAEYGEGMAALFAEEATRLAGPERVLRCLANYHGRSERDLEWIGDALNGDELATEWWLDTFAVRVAAHMWDGWEAGVAGLEDEIAATNRWAQ